MEKKAFSPIVFILVLAAFGIVCFVMFFKTNKYLVNYKMKLGAILLTFSTISSGCVTSSCYYFGYMPEKFEQRLEVKLEQNISDIKTRPNPGLRYDLEYHNTTKGFDLYSGLDLKFNFNSTVSGLYLGPNIGFVYNFNWKGGLFTEFDNHYMIANFDKLNNDYSSTFGTNLGYSYRHNNYGYAIYCRFERNYTHSNNSFMIGGKVFLNFKY